MGVCARNVPISPGFHTCGHTLVTMITTRRICEFQAARLSSVLSDNAAILLGSAGVQSAADGVARSVHAVLVRLLANSASIDQGPGPTIAKKAQFKSCAYSERISWRTAQKPICGGTGGSGSGDVPRYRGIFVEAIATIISMMNGMAMKRVSKPVSSSRPPMISK